VEIKKSISIIVPNYNNSRLLQELLPYTYKAIKNAGVIYEIIIVDDCSTDGSVEFISSDYPEVVLVVNPENKGLSYAYNRGIEIARYELILLLNPCIKLSPDYFEHQWKYFLAWDTFGVMGRIMDMEGDHIQDAAHLPKFTGFKLNTDYVYYTNDSNNRLLTFYLSGANALINAEKLKQIGGFYELSSSFCGDMELSIRAWRLNWKCYYEHNAICKRQVLTNSKSDKSGKLVENIYCRNLFYLHALHLNGSALIGWYFQIIIIDLLPKLLKGQTWIWKSYKDLFRDRKVIKMYKERIKNLLNKNESRTTIFNVVTKIRNSVKNKKLIALKPDFYK
jgi:GT2 family glycosyltransferase